LHPSFETGALRPFPVLPANVYPLARAAEAYQAVLAGAPERVVLDPTLYAAPCTLRGQRIRDAGGGLQGGLSKGAPGGAGGFEPMAISNENIPAALPNQNSERSGPKVAGFYSATQPQNPPLGGLLLLPAYAPARAFAGRPTAIR
jgi:hypothetical protein